MSLKESIQKYNQIIENEGEFKYIKEEFSDKQIKERLQILLDILHAPPTDEEIQKCFESIDWNAGCKIIKCNKKIKRNKL